MPDRGFLEKFVEGRVFEWVMTCSMIMMAFEILIWAGTLNQSAFRYILEVADSSTIGIAVLLIGWSRVSALMLNGQTVFEFKAGPFVRAVASVLSSVIWFQFVFALVQYSFISNTPSPGIPFWFMVTVGELYVAYQTVKNA